MTTLFTFPGQGAQRLGMVSTLRALAHEEPGIAAVLDEVRQFLGERWDLVDDAASLATSVGAQMSLLIAGVAGARRLIARGAQPSGVAGFSVGAFAAAVVAGSLDFGDALRLVHRRATLMAEAFPQGYGMLAVVGLNLQEVQAIVQRLDTANAPLRVANHNASRQFVIAGADAGLTRVAEDARASGASCARRVAMAVPSHCDLLDAQARELEAALSAVEIRPPSIDWFSAQAVRRLRQADAIRRDLAWNMARPVRWSDTAQLAIESGARVIVEMPPGHVLTRLVRQDAAGDVICLSMDDEPIDSIAEHVRREMRRA